MENVTYMQAGPVLIIGLPEEVDDHVCNGIREETDRYISAGKVQKLIFDFSKTGFMDSSGIGILLGRYKRMHHMGGEVLVTGEDAKIRRHHLCIHISDSLTGKLTVKLQVRSA